MNPLKATAVFRQIPAPKPCALRTITNCPRQQLSRRYLHSKPSPPSLLRNSAALPIRFRQQNSIAHQQRCESSAARPLTDRPDHIPKPDTAREEQPAYEMTFTCRVCTDRSTHRITKQGYHHGTILITCPGCKNRHLISDHLKIFSDKSTTIEDILKEKGQLLKKGALGGEGDVEFWDDGTQTERKKPEDENKSEAS